MFDVFISKQTANYSYIFRFHWIKWVHQNRFVSIFFPFLFFFKTKKWLSTYLKRGIRQSVTPTTRFFIVVVSKKKIKSALYAWIANGRETEFIAKTLKFALTIIENEMRAERNRKVAADPWFLIRNFDCLNWLETINIFRTITVEAEAAAAATGNNNNHQTKK